MTDRNYALEYRQKKQRTDQAEEIAREIEERRASVVATKPVPRKGHVLEFSANEYGYVERPQ
jgi:hypothetical protein